MSRARSIGERMRIAKSLKSRREAALDWAANWYADHLATLHSLEKALGRGSVVEAGRYCGQLKVLHEKALGALPGVIDALSDEDIV